jgi:HECT-domain (ubiquitin-transferase)
VATIVSLAVQAAAKYEAGFSAATDAVVWLWDIAINEFDLSEKRMFLKFFTGACSRPIGSFAQTAQALACT